MIVCVMVASKNEVIIRVGKDDILNNATAYCSVKDVDR